ncbi:MAG: DUF4847 domain-containing protein [Mediterranea sp.]|jgi:hypothetical protein|nr:DUF4847 domain-containing protein [Mediterranea sp.]
MRVRNAYKLWVALLLLPLLAGCTQTDDVEAIFGKTWKLTYITLDGKHEMYDFWNRDGEAYNESMKQLAYAQTYILQFNGLATGENIKGTLSGTTINSTTYSGSWSANGRTNAFKAAATGGRTSDLLTTKYMEGLTTATSYEGDKNNLFLIYTPAGSSQTFRMCFKAID